MKDIEKLLGRKASKMEKILYDMYKDNKEYHFEKDKLGNLISIKNT